MKNRTVALVSGWSIVGMAIIGGFALGYAFPQFYIPNLLVDSNFDQLRPLYKMMITGILVTLILDLVVSYTLFKYFAQTNKKRSLIAGILRAIYTVVFAVATVYMARNLWLDDPSSEVFFAYLNQFRTIWYLGLLLFGAHLFLIGTLMRMQRIIPFVYWGLTILAGISYILVHTVKLLVLAPSIVGYFEMILSLPMIAGELGLAIWLILKGGKQKVKPS